MTSNKPPAGHSATPSSISCLVLFLLPFAGVGLFAAVQVVRSALAGDWGQAGFLGIFALVFGGVGIGGIAGALAGRHKVAEAALLRERHPESPWLWRDDWAAGRIEDSGRATMWTAWAFAAFWNLVSLPAAWFGVREVVEKGNMAALLALLFPLVGMGLLIWAVKATLRFHRYGVSVLELQATPGVVGHGLTGAVRTTSALMVPEGFQVTLTCLRRVTRGSGKNRSTSETILWQEDRRARGEASRGASGMNTTIPVAFALPDDATPCDDRDPRDRVLWRLDVTASVPGVDYASSFEVPVFRTAESARIRTAEETAALMDPSAAAEYRQPTESRIRVATNRRGTEVVFPAARNPGVAIGVSCFLFIWTASIWFMLRVGAPVIFPIVFGLFELLLLWGALELWLRVTRVTAEQGVITIASGYLAAGGERRFTSSEISDITTKIGMQAGGKPYYDLALVRTNGKRVTLAHGVRDKREAEWLAALLKDALGGGGQRL
jgi:hypothetical protein